MLPCYLVVDYRSDPGEKGSFAPKRFDSLNRFDQGRLNHIFGIVDSSKSVSEFSVVLLKPLGNVSGQKFFPCGSITCPGTTYTINGILTRHSHALLPCQPLILATFRTACALDPCSLYTERLGTQPLFGTLARLSYCNKEC